MQTTIEETSVLQKTKELCQAILDQPNMQSIRQRIDAAVEHLKELVRGPAALARALSDRCDTREHILDAVVELSDQGALMILGALALGDVNTDTKHPLRAVTVV